MRISKFAIPEIIFGRGSIVHLASCAKRLGARRVLLVSDQGIVGAGWVDRMKQRFREKPAPVGPAKPPAPAATQAAGPTAAKG